MSNPPKRHIFTSEDFGSKDPIEWELTCYLNLSPVLIERIYLDAALWARAIRGEIILQWSFGRDKCWIESDRWGRVYIERLSPELEALT